MKHFWRTIALSSMLLLTTTPAQADIFEVWAHGLAGGAIGNGKADRDFFDWVSGGAAGVEAGVSLLFLSAYVDYLRFFGGDTGGYLVGINLGGDSSFSLTDNLSIVVRIAGAYYFGGLDDANRIGANGGIVSTRDVHTQGIGLRGGIGPRYELFPFVAIGVTPQIAYHYFFAGAESITANENSSGWDFQALAYLRLSLGI